MPKFELRGASSIPDVRSEYEGDPNMPVFIVDGFEMSVEKVFDLDPGRIANSDDPERCFGYRHLWFPGFERCCRDRDPGT